MNIPATIVKNNSLEQTVIFPVAATSPCGKSRC